MAMQTGKKRIAKVADMPTDKYFIVADDSKGRAMLEGEFLTVERRVVDYPVGSSVAEVIEAFKEYIGLGHYETKE